MCLIFTAISKLSLQEYLFACVLNHSLYIEQNQKYIWNLHLLGNILVTMLVKWTPLFETVIESRSSIGWSMCAVRAHSKQLEELGHLHWSFIYNTKRPLWWAHLNVWKLKSGRWTFFGPLVIEQRCLAYQYTKIGRQIYFGQWTPKTRWIKHRCLEYHYTKHYRFLRAQCKDNVECVWSSQQWPN